MHSTETAARFPQREPALDKRAGRVGERQIEAEGPGDAGAVRTDAGIRDTVNTARSDALHAESAAFDTVPDDTHKQLRRVHAPEIRGSGAASSVTGERHSVDAECHAVDFHSDAISPRDRQLTDKEAPPPRWTRNSASSVGGLTWPLRRTLMPVSANPTPTDGRAALDSHDSVP